MSAPIGRTVISDWCVNARQFSCRMQAVLDPIQPQTKGTVDTMSEEAKETAHEQTPRAQPTVYRQWFEYPSRFIIDMDDVSGIWRHSTDTDDSTVYFKSGATAAMEIPHGIYRFLIKSVKERSQYLLQRDQMARCGIHAP